jgi:ferredoxin-NADP reductase
MNVLNLWVRKLISPIDKLLDRLTSYRLVLYFLFVLLIWSIVGSLQHKVGYNLYDIILSAVVLFAACLGSNYLISKKLKIAKNNESDYISALILILILRKMKRFIMAITFELVALAAICAESYLNHNSTDFGHLIWLSLISTSLLFFTYIMLTEPQTTPRHMSNYLPYAVLVGFLYGYTKLGISPEQALLIGNVFAYIIEPNRRFELSFVRKVTEASGIDSFIFSGKEKFKYTAGQYMEWTLQDNRPDLRGNRRYLTISSSPTEPDLMFTLRIPEKKSKFKQNLEGFKKGDKILASQLAGEFILPKSEKQKLAFLAGGVGITPFRSMIKYAADFGHQRDIHLLYSANKEDEFAFKGVFGEAKKFGVETSYSAEQITAEKITQTVPDYKERVFYISGPYGFVHAMENNLIGLGLPLRQIKTDYFPGYEG